MSWFFIHLCALLNFDLLKFIPFDYFVAVCNSLLCCSCCLTNNKKKKKKKKLFPYKGDKEQWGCSLEEWMPKRPVFPSNPHSNQKTYSSCLSMHIKPRCTSPTAIFPSHVKVRISLAITISSRYIHQVYAPHDHHGKGSSGSPTRTDAEDPWPRTQCPPGFNRGSWSQIEQYHS